MIPPDITEEEYRGKLKTVNLNFKLTWKFAVPFMHHKLKCTGNNAKGSAGSRAIFSITFATSDAQAWGMMNNHDTSIINSNLNLNLKLNFDDEPRSICEMGMDGCRFPTCETT